MISRASLTFLVFMLACAGLFAGLGVWQVKRLHWKQNIISQLDQEFAKDARQYPVTAGDIEKLTQGDLRRGSFTGIFQFDKAFRLSGQIDDGKSSQHLIVPVKLGAISVLTDFGAEFKLPQGRTADATITGLIKYFPQPNNFTPANNAAAEIWYSFDTVSLSKVYEIENLQPFVILPETTPWHDFTVSKPEIRNAHLQYATFWFALSGMTILMTALYLRKQKAA